MTTFYFTIDYNGQAIVRIDADSEDDATIAAGKAQFSLMRCEPPVVSYRFMRDDPVMVKAEPGQT